MSDRPDIYTTITNRIVEQLEAGVRPWERPWSTDHLPQCVRPLRSNGEPYKGINVLVLWGAAMDAGYSSPYWFTFKQALELGEGVHVRKGEKGTQVVYASTFKKRETSEAGDVTEEEIPFMKAYTVFNAEQIEGIPAEYLTAAEPLTPMERLENAERYFSATGATVRHQGGRAYYSASYDYIQMPIPEAFRDVESYTATLSHEFIHWTKGPNRLVRDLGRKKWGDEGYALEELVAELGSAFLCADLQITPEIRPDHASYIASWLKVLKDDKRAIFTAASMASKAVDYLDSLQPVEEEEPIESDCVEA